MRKLAVLAAFGPFLAGCGAYNAGAIPAASQAYGVAMDRCNAATASAQTFSQGMECIISADRQFAVSIKLRDMSLFENYATRLRLLAQDVDAGRVTGQPVVDRYLTIKGEYTQAVEYAQQRARQQAAAVAAGLAGAGQALQREADRQAFINAANRSVTCNSSRFGNQVTTTCN